MDRSLILPLSIAAALHAGVLFGFNRGPVPKVAKVVPNIPLSTFKNLPEEPEIEEKPLSEEKAPTRTAELVPRSVEPPPAAPDPTRFEMKPVPPVQTDVHLKDLANVDFGTTRNAGDAMRLLLAIDLDNPPRTRVQIAPPYPPEARRLGLNGKVLVEFMVDETGRVLDPRVVSSSNAVFDETTVRTLVRWRFEPGKKGGRAVRFRMALPLEFKLDEN